MMELILGAFAIVAGLMLAMVYYQTQLRPPTVVVVERSTPQMAGCVSTVLALIVVFFALLSLISLRLGVL